VHFNLRKLLLEDCSMGTQGAGLLSAALNLRQPTELQVLSLKGNLNASQELRQVSLPS
jgi:Ran GTPase-activating protein (RanGAP) involved in mRNA processing and transport